jgi:methionyl aminopeptidase
MTHLIKNPEEIATIRRAGVILGEILYKLRASVVEGKSPIDIEYHAIELFKEYGVEPGFKGYQGFPNICCISVNDNVVHGIPNDTLMKNGDLVTIDCGVLIDGLNTDAAISVIVGGDDKATKKIQELNRITKKAMHMGIREVRPGAKVGDIGNAIAKVVEGAGFSIIRELTGHGIGYDLHEDPQILNYGKKGTGPALKPGMVICIEPIVSAGERFIHTLDDHWTIAVKDGSWGCQWEHTILVTPNGHEILTEYVPTS